MSKRKSPEGAGLEAMVAVPVAVAAAAILAEGSGSASASAVMSPPASAHEAGLLQPCGAPGRSKPSVSNSTTGKDPAAGGLGATPEGASSAPCFGLSCDGDCKYIPQTKIPAAGWFQPCRTCRQWTAATLTVEATEVSICKKCQLCLVRTYSMKRSRSGPTDSSCSTTLALDAPDPVTQNDSALGDSVQSSPLFT